MDAGFTKLTAEFQTFNMLFDHVGYTGMSDLIEYIKVS